MTAVTILDIARDAIFTYLQMSLPLMLSALIVGLIVGLLQALTQIQEMTLAFVPKIIIMFLAFIFFMPFIGNSLFEYTQNITTFIVMPQ